MELVKKTVMVKNIYFLEKIKSFGIIRLAVISVAVIIVIWGIVKITEKPSGHPVVLVDEISADSVYLHADSLVKPFIYTEVPDLSVLNKEERKKRFIHLLLPSILLAQEKMASQLEQVKLLIERKEVESYSLNDSLLLDEYLERFNAQNPQDLINRMQPSPVSIILAQAAIESGWGTSRFFMEANNVFGIWSFNSEEDRIRAGQSRGGRSVYLRSYDSLFDSIYDYLMVIARGNAYKDYRETLVKSQNPYRLIWFLSNYSEKRLSYVSYLRQMIEFNDLVQYDHYTLVKIDKRDENWQKISES